MISNHAVIKDIFWTALSANEQNSLLNNCLNLAAFGVTHTTETLKMFQAEKSVKGIFSGAIQERATNVQFSVSTVLRTF